MDEIIDVFIVDDHQIVIDGIKLLLLSVKDINLSGEANTGEEILSLLNKQTPQVIILDLILPDISGTELIRKITEKYPAIKIIVFTGNTPDELLIQALQAGASGILLKNSSQEEIIKAIKLVTAGKKYLGEKINNKILTNLLDLIKKPNSSKSITGLTKREIEVVKLIAEGLTYKEIGRKLNISTHTVESHKNNILKKLKLNSIVELVKYSIKNKIVEL